MAMWLWVQIIAAATAGVSGTIGATAPTGKRLGTFITEVRNLAPVGTSNDHVSGEWGVLKVDAGDIQVATGHHWIQFRATKKQSADIGSPIQGWNWGLGAGCDEIQDSLSAYEDIVARLRSGKNAPIFGTATAKDSPKWRTWRDALSDNWEVHRISYLDTPFVHDEHWAMMKEECSPREWKRRGLALDVPPENVTYVTWDREKNLRKIPLLGARDVTREVLARYDGGELLLGHDPGQIQDVTEILKAYVFGKDKFHSWVVVDELTTNRTTTEAHVSALNAHLRKNWSFDGDSVPKCHVRIDPFGDSDNKTDISVYQHFRNGGFAAHSAAYKNGKGSGRVPKEAGIEMVTRLICNANNVRRLFVKINDDGKPAAPRLVAALEMSERDLSGRAEMDKKDINDLSHWPSALRFALHPFEKRVVS